MLYMDNLSRRYLGDVSGWLEQTFMLAVKDNIIQVPLKFPLLSTHKISLRQYFSQRSINNYIYVRLSYYSSVSLFAIHCFAIHKIRRKIKVSTYTVFANYFKTFARCAYIRIHLTPCSFCEVLCVGRSLFGTNISNQ